MAKEYIERDALLEEIQAAIGKGGLGGTVAGVLRRYVKCVPAADVVEVVRKPVSGYEGYYEVDQFGRVFSLGRVVTVKDGDRIYEKPIAGRQMKQTMHDKGYKTVSLTKDGKTKTLFVHRLVADAFIENPNNLPMVNHKDEDKTNNFAENLEWCTNEYNLSYGTARHRQAKKLRGRPHTEEHKAKIASSMKKYREKERNEKGYCYNGVGKRRDNNAAD